MPIVYFTYAKLEPKSSQNNGMKSLFLVLTFSTVTAFGQGEEEAVKATINRLFEGMRKADSMLIKSSLAPIAILQTIMQKEEGTTAVQAENIQEFITAVTQPHLEVYDERIVFEAIRIDAALATE